MTRAERIAEMAARGLYRLQIAEELGVTSRTVDREIQLHRIAVPRQRKMSMAEKRALVAAEPIDQFLRRAA